jgi:competence protein ComEA
MKMKLLSMLVLGLASIAPSFAHAADTTPVETTIETSTQVLVYVHINYDDAERLAELLEGVGEVKAQAIVDFRNEFGTITELDQLLAVKGIGAKTLEKNKDTIVFDLKKEVKG